MAANDHKPASTKQWTFIFSQSGGQKSLEGGSFLPARALEAPGTQSYGRISHLCLPFRRPSSLCLCVRRQVCKDRFRSDVLRFQGDMDLAGLGSRLNPGQSRVALAWLWCPSPSAAQLTLCHHSMCQLPRTRELWWPPCPCTLSRAWLVQFT